MTGEPVPQASEIPEWQLERYLLGELPVREAEAVRGALDRDRGLRERLALLERSSEALLEQYPPEALGRAVRAARASAGERSRASTGRRPRLALAALAAAVLVAVVLVAPRLPPRSDSPDTIRVKGLTPHLLVYRKGAAEVERLEPGTAARPGDQVQLAYQAAGRRYGVIVSVDGRGVVTRHLPIQGREAVALEPGPPVPLGESYQLDDAPRFECFYLVTADEPFPVELVVAAAKALDPHRSESPAARLPLPDAMDQFRFDLDKETSR